MPAWMIDARLQTAYAVRTHPLGDTASPALPRLPAVTDQQAGR